MVVLFLCGDPKACEQLRQNVAEWGLSHPADPVELRLPPDSADASTASDAVAFVGFTGSLPSLELIVHEALPQYGDLIQTVPCALVTVDRPHSPPSAPENITSYPARLQSVLGTLEALPSFEGHHDVVDAASARACLQLLVETVRHPRHLLWSKQNQALTALGRVLFIRAFWLFDGDRDGVLKHLEFQKFAESLYGPLEGDAISDLTATTHAGASGLTRDSFLAYCEQLIAQNKTQAVWAMLARTGISPAGQPIRAKDLSFIRQASDILYEPTPAAKDFLEHIYLRGFPRKKLADPWDGWSVVPDGVPGPVQDPWSDSRPAPVAPFKAGWDDGRPETFVAHWSYRCLAHPESFVRYCLYWGYDGDLPALLTPRRRTRNVAQASRKTVIQALVLGSSGCGKTALIQYLTSKRLPGLHAYRPTRRPFSALGGRIISAGAERLRFATVYHELVDSDVNSFITDPKEMDAMDVVLMLYDGSDPYSFSFLQAKQMKMLRCGLLTLPYIYIMTKCDLPQANQLGCKPQEFVRGLRLSWPPVFVSVLEAPGAHPHGLTNDIQSLPELIIETARNPECAMVAIVQPSLRLRRSFLFLTGILAVAVVTSAVLITRRRCK